jgi:ribosome-associated protein
LTADGVLLIDSREHRLQSQNREAARARLASLIRHALIRPRSRTPTRPKAGARERRLAVKKLRGDIKAARGRKRHDDD